MKQALSNASVSDFVIIEYNGKIGGRCRNTKFGKDPSGNPYTVELGDNWVRIRVRSTIRSGRIFLILDLTTTTDTRNGHAGRSGKSNLYFGMSFSPRCRRKTDRSIQAKKHNIRSTTSNASRIDTFTPQGRKDYRAKQDVFDEAYKIMEQDAGVILKENLQDRSFRAGLRLAGYDSARDPEASVWEWYSVDFEYAQTPVRFNDRARTHRWPADC